MYPAACDLSSGFMNNGCCPCRELSSALSRLLGVEAVFCDTRSPESAQQFVLWAGRILQHRSVPALPASCWHTMEYESITYALAACALCYHKSCAHLGMQPGAQPPLIYEGLQCQAKPVWFHQEDSWVQQVSALGLRPPVLCCLVHQIHAQLCSYRTSVACLMDTSS